MKAGKSILLVLFTLAVTAYGSPEPNSLIKLRDYLAYAETHNAGLISKKQQWIAALEDVPQAKALPDPQVKYDYWTKQSDLQMKQTIEVMQMFPWFGKIDARTEAAIKTAASAQQEYQAARLELLREVKENFYEFAYLAKAIKIAIENVELLKHFEAVARTKYTAAEAGQPDVIRAQVELAKMEYTLRSLEPLRKPIASKLLKILTLPKDMNLPWPEVEEFNVAPLDYERLAATLRQKNPELAGLDLEVLAAKSRIELAKKNFYPDIGVGVMWENMDKPGRDGVAMVFQMNLPLWRSSYSAGQRQAEALTISKTQEKIDTENTLLAKAAQSYYDYGDSIRRIQLYRDTLIPKSEELLQASETAYKAGTIDFFALIDSQRLLLDYHLSHERALADNRQKLAELEMLAGAELVSEGTN